MAKKRTSNTKRSSRTTRRSSKSTSSWRSVIIIIVILLGAFIANRLGIIDSETFEQIVSSVVEGDGVSEGKAPPPNATPVVVEPVSGDWYQLYFTTPQYPDKPETRIDTIAQALIGVINNAQSSLDIAIYELDLPNVGEAILAARDRGVEVRMVTDTDRLEELDTLIHLEDEGIPIVDDKRGAIMHNKFVVVDNKAVWTGSWNFTPNGTFRNNNNAIFIQSPELAENYTAEFEEMFVAKEFGPTSPANTPNPRIIIGDTLIETCFAPEDECAGQIVDLINQAQKSIYFLAFSFTHEDIGKAVQDRANDGVLVRGVFETRGSDTQYSEFGAMKRKKLDVLQDGNPYTLHHKVFIVDDEIVVFGSFNFSNNADDSNDENVLIIHNPNLAQTFLGEFERVYAQAQNPPN